MLDSAEATRCRLVRAVVPACSQIGRDSLHGVGYGMSIYSHRTALSWRRMLSLCVSLVAILISGDMSALAGARVVLPNMSQGSCVLLVQDDGSAVLFLSAREDLAEVEALLTTIDRQAAGTANFSVAHVVVTDANTTPDGIAFVGAVVAACRAHAWAAPVLHVAYPYSPCAEILAASSLQELELRLLVPGLTEDLGGATMTCYQVGGLTECGPGGIYRTSGEPSCAAELLVECGSFRLWLGSSGVQDSGELASVCPDVDVYVMDVRSDQLWSGHPLAAALAPEVIVLQSADAPRQTLLGMAIALLGVADSDGTALDLTSHVLVQGVSLAVPTESFHPFGMVQSEESLGRPAALLCVGDDSYRLQVGNTFLRTLEIGCGATYILDIHWTDHYKIVPGCVGASRHTAAVTVNGVTHYLASFGGSSSLSVQSSRAASLRLFAKSVEPDPTYDEVGQTCLWLRIPAEEAEQDVYLDVEVSEGYGPGAGCSETWRFTFHISVHEVTAEQASP